MIQFTIPYKLHPFSTLKELPPFLWYACLSQLQSSFLVNLFPLDWESIWSKKPLKNLKSKERSRASLKRGKGHTCSPPLPWFKRDVVSVFTPFSPPPPPSLLTSFPLIFACLIFFFSSCSFSFFFFFCFFTPCSLIFFPPFFSFFIREEWGKKGKKRSRD